MTRENRQLVTDEPVEFERKQVVVQNCRKINDHFRGICRIYPNLVKENRRMLTCNRSDLQTLGSHHLSRLCPKISSIADFDRLFLKLAAGSPRPWT